ncbi:MAG: hypothetical protein ACK5Q5_16090 [Planctomycetaceae bacterium]
MSDADFNPESYFRAAWDSVHIVRPVQYTLFTFGESELQYILVVDSELPRQPVSVTRGEIKITRPLIITPNNASPEFQHFFEEGDDYSEMVDFLMTRSAAFRHLQLSNLQKRPELHSDSVDEVVSRLNRKLDDLDEDRVAVLTAPHGLGGVAVLKYAADRVMQSAPGNIQELREKGFLPED